MANVFTNKLRQVIAGASATTVVSNAYTPTTDSLQIAIFHGRGSVASDPTLAGAGLTWVLVRRANGYGDANRWVVVFRALGTGSNGALTLTRAGADTFNEATCIVEEVAGCDTTGTNGSGAVSQSVVSAGLTTTAPSVDITVNSSVNSILGIFVGWGSGAETTAGTGYTGLSEISFTSSPNTFDLPVGTEYRTSTDTNADFTLSESTVCLALALEIVPAATGPTITTQPTAQTARLNGEPTTTATFTTAATGTGTVTITSEIESGVGSGTYGTLANGSGATWTGLTGTGSASASTSLVGTFTALTLTGRRIRSSVTDGNGTTISTAVVLTVKVGPVLSATSGTGVGTLDLVSDEVLTAGYSYRVTITAGAVALRSHGRSL